MPDGFSAPDALATMPAVEIARLVTTGALSAIEVVERTITRIGERNGVLNAVTESMADTARRSAAEIDRKRRASEPIGPLAGVPFSVKSNIDVAGSATTHGIAALRNAIAPTDAPVVERLRRAGAIPIAHTNMPDLSVRFHTSSQLHGDTVNPWDARLTPGGSSGGDGVAVATGMSALGVGNDAGGSVRVPALFAGVSALKPTTGRLPSDRSIGPRDLTFASQVVPVEGFLARTVADLRIALAVAAGPHPRDPRALPAPLSGPAPRTPTTVGVVVDPGGMGVHAGAETAVHTAARALEAAGYRLDFIDVPRLEETLAAYGGLIMTEFAQAWPTMQRLLGPNGRRYIELAMELGKPRDLVGYLELTAVRHGLQRAWTELLDTHPVILGPVYTGPVPPANYDIQGLEEHASCGRALRLCSATSFVGLPAVSVPVGLTDGVPQGVQVIANYFREDLCLEAAEAIEAHAGFTLERIAA
ncbi:MAG TPA: amidase [Gemmatimonadaceae bacterium]|jgi:amidase|nr:amidase [Gemmatimonadaceae bacterium]